MHTSLAIKCLGKLVDCWRYFESLLQNCQLALKTNVLRPSHKAAKISFWLNILPCNTSKKLSTYHYSHSADLVLSIWSVCRKQLFYCINFLKCPTIVVTVTL